MYAAPVKKNRREESREAAYSDAQNIRMKKHGYGFVDNRPRPIGLNQPRAIKGDGFGRNTANTIRPMVIQRVFDGDLEGKSPHMVMTLLKENGYKVTVQDISKIANLETRAESYNTAAEIAGQLSLTKQGGNLQSQITEKPPTRKKPEGQTMHSEPRPGKQQNVGAVKSEALRQNPQESITENQGASAAAKESTNPKQRDKPVPFIWGSFPPLNPPKTGTKVVHPRYEKDTIPATVNGESVNVRFGQGFLNTNLSQVYKDNEDKVKTTGVQVRQGMNNGELQNNEIHISDGHHRAIWCGYHQKEMIVEYKKPYSPGVSVKDMSYKVL